MCMEGGGEFVCLRVPIVGSGCSSKSTILTERLNIVFGGSRCGSRGGGGGGGATLYLSTPERTLSCPTFIASSNEAWDEKGSLIWPDWTAGADP